MEFNFPFRDTNLFQRVRLTAYGAILIGSIVVLGVAAHLASKFLPQYHSTIIAFSLIASVLTIVVLILAMLRSQPRIDMFFLFILAILWLAMGAYTTDFIGHVECFALGSLTTPTKGGGTMSARTYCYELKTLQAFSWTNFGILLIAFIVLLCLVLRVLAHGRHTIWRESISDLPFFGQMGGYQGQPVLPVQYSYAPQQPYYLQQQQQFAMPQQAYFGGQNGYGQNGGVVMQQPGYSVMVQPQMPGQPPLITQVPYAPMAPGAIPQSSVPHQFEA